MELQRARDVKGQLERIFVTRVRGPRSRRFALGLTANKGRDQYGIAVRAPSQEELAPGDLDVIHGLAGAEVDVRYTGEIRALSGSGASSPRSSSRRLTMGVSIAHYCGVTGSLGFFARRRTDGVIGLVSNNHVLAASDHGKDSDDILHPPPAAGGVLSLDTVARLDGGYPRLNRRRPRVDCAFAPLVDGIDFDPRSLGACGSLSPHSVRAEDAMNIAKIGDATGLTHGRISAFEFAGLTVRYPMLTFIRFDAQIEIQRTGDKPFACDGDSGALAFTGPDNQPVGLLFAMAPRGGPDDTELTYANPIDAVLSSLDVSFAP